MHELFVSMYAALLHMYTTTYMQICSHMSHYFSWDYSFCQILNLVNMHIIKFNIIMGRMVKVVPWSLVIGKGNVKVNEGFLLKGRWPCISFLCLTPALWETGSARACMLLQTGIKLGSVRNFRFRYHWEIHFPLERPVDNFWNTCIAPSEEYFACSCAK